MSNFWGAVHNESSLIFYGRCESSETRPTRPLPSHIFTKNRQFSPCETNKKADARFFLASAPDIEI